MATQQELLNQASEIRDAELEGENTAVRVGTMLINLIEYLSNFVSTDDLDNYATAAALEAATVGMQTSLNKKADIILMSNTRKLRIDEWPLVSLYSTELVQDADAPENKMWWSAENSRLKYKHSGVVYEIGDPAYTLYYCGYKIFKWTGSGFAEMKVSVINNLTAGGIDTPLSAEQGKILKVLIDNEILARSNGDSAIAGDISSLQSAINEETSARQSAITEETSARQSADNQKTDKDQYTSKLTYSQAPDVVLATMGATLDNAGNTGNQQAVYIPHVGDTYWDSTSGHVKFKESASTTHDLGEPNPGLVYCNKQTDLTYRWAGSSGWKQVGGAPSSAGGSIVTVTEDENYVNVNIIDNTPVLSVSAESIGMGGDTKTAIFKVSGLRLRGDINIGVSGTGFSVDKESISPVDGTVAETTVTVTYGGSASASGSITVSSSGAVPASISLTYTEQQVPTIIADDTAISFKAGGGSTQQKTLTVQGVNLEDGISADISGTDAAKFSISGSPISQSGGVASGTLTITYSPAAADSGTHEATLTLSSSGATSKVITLNGDVSSLTVSKQTMTFSTDQGVAVTDTFTVEGTNLREAITTEASGTGFSVSPQTIDNIDSSGTVASTTVTVTYQPSAAGTHTGSISIQSSGVTKTISLSGTAAQATTSDENGRFSKEISGNTIYFGRISDGNGGFTNDVAVYNKEYNTSSAAASANRYTGDIVIPATVACDGTTYNVTTIAQKAFHSCSGMTSLTLPEGLTVMKFEAIRDCTNSSFTSLIIPNSVTTMEANNLYECNKLTNLVFGDGLTGIPTYVMPGKNGMTNVVIGSNIASFANYVEFRMADSGVVTIKRETPPSYQVVVFKTASNTYPSNATLKVPASAVDTYKNGAGYGVDNSSGWRMFNPDNIVAIDE